MKDRVRQIVVRRRAPEPEPVPVVVTGESNFSPAKVPWGYDLAAQWSWRFLVITAALLTILAGLRFFAVLVFPIIIALFIAALTAPLVAGLTRIGVPRKLAALLVVIGGIAAVSLLLTFVTQQVTGQMDELTNQVADGLGKIRDWLQDGPLHASDSQINDWIGQAQDFLKREGKELATRASELSTAVGHILAGFFLILFSTYFFLADGHLIWAWLVRIFPRAARARADESGRVAWTSLTQFVRATVLVAAVDALGIMIWAIAWKVPLASAIGVLVFLGAFVPMVGATVSGVVAVLVALVAHGPVIALVMLGGVIAVQQLEAHILQPFLLGRLVSVHPLGVIIAIAAGVIAAGIIGALVAVPLAASLNAVVQYLASHTEVGEDAEEAAATDPEADPQLAREAEEREAEEGVSTGSTSEDDDT